MPAFFKTSDHEQFFSLLPEDWRSGISDSWNSFANRASIYLLRDQDQIKAGGIVFSVCPPDMYYDKKEAQKWLDSGYLYIGFLWVPEEFRGHNFGSIWLQSLKEAHPSQKFWLSIEEENLRFFYIKNGFQLVKSLQNGPNKEWLLTYEPA
jgi:ribosomal protein S18 acetylase RimI-like enzyme